MRIQHNIMAMNAYRNYNTNTSALSKNLEKLSSGYKINRAGDDAAGLAISEKMRAQITGLNAAQKNVKDGISLVKTAEGAMQEIQDMLNRMDYLATQSANGTYDNEVDRANLQKEVDALKTEIDRIADSANFNGIKLLDGSQSSSGTSGTAGKAGYTVEGGTDVGSSVLTAIADAKDAGRPAQKGIYEIDMSNWSTSVTAAKATIAIVVAGKTIAKAEISGASKGSPITVNYKDLVATKTQVTIGNSKFNVRKDGDKLVLTMAKIPSSDFDENLEVTITGDQKADASNQGQALSVEVKQPAVAINGAKYAQASLNLKNLNGGIIDGAQLSIGDQIYTFKLNKDSNVSGKNVVDLSYLSDADKEDPNGDKLCREAARELSRVASGNSLFKVTTTNSSGKIHLTERLSENKPYTNDMIGKSNAVDATWTDLVQYSKTGGMTVIGGESVSTGLKLQIGDTSDSFNQLTVSIGDMHISAMGLTSIDISNQTGAQGAIQKIKDAINYVSGIRGDLGATQNRLEHTANNLSVMAENIQDAESSIRDTDVAEEMMAYTKNNILIQSAQAMLAQANAVPQGVLQLLG